MAGGSRYLMQAEIRRPVPPVSENSKILSPSIPRDPVYLKKKKKKKKIESIPRNPVLHLCQVLHSIGHFRFRQATMLPFRRNYY